MSNSNDPSRGNIQPDPSGGGAGAVGGIYAGLAMLGVAALRWMWPGESEGEIQKVKDQHEKEVSTLNSEILTLQQKLGSQSLQLIKERKAFKEEKQRIENSTRGILNRALKQEDNWYKRATDTLMELEGQLMDRQDIYCSCFKPRDQRLEIEKNMLLKVVEDPIVAELNLESDLRDVFKRDKHCAGMLNTDKRKNGRLMWVYLKYWQEQVTVQKFKRANEAILGGKIK